MSKKISKTEKMIVKAVLGIIIAMYAIPKVLIGPGERLQAKSIVTAEQELQPIQKSIENAVINQKTDVFFDKKMILKQSMVLQDFTVQNDGRIFFTIKGAPKTTETVYYILQPQIQGKSMRWTLRSNQSSVNPILENVQKLNPAIPVILQE